MRNLDQMGCLDDFAVADFPMQVGQRKPFCHQGAGQGNNHDQPNSLTDSNVAQQLHETSARLVLVSIIFLWCRQRILFAVALRLSVEYVKT